MENFDVLFERKFTELVKEFDNPLFGDWIIQTSERIKKMDRSDPSKEENVCKIILLQRQYIEFQRKKVSSVVEDMENRLAQVASGSIKMALNSLSDLVR